MLEKADRAWSGGNSAFTAGAIRIAHGGLEDVRELLAEEPLPDTDLEPYTEEDFLGDMRRVTLGRGDPAMARTLVGDSRDVVRWLAGHGVRFRLMYERQSYEAAGRHRFWGGLAVGAVDGGAGLMDGHRAAAGRSGIELRHETAVEDLLRDTNGRVSGVVARSADGTRSELRARAVVLAAGGFESDPRLRAAHLGPNWDVAKVRGTPSNTGEVLEAALRHGAQAYGHWSGCHAIQWDAGAPATGDLEITNRFSRQSYPVGIVVNRRGERFLDEGEDFRNYTYAKFGARVLEQPEGVAAQVFDAKTIPLLRTIDYEAPGATRVDADTLEGLAEGLGIDPDGLRAHGRGVQRGDRRPAVRSRREGRPAHRGHHAGEVQLGAGDRHAAVRGVPGDVRDHVHVRRRARRRRRGRAGRGRPPHPRAVRGRGAGRRPVLPQLPGRQRPDGGRRLGPPRGVDGRHDGVIALRHLHAPRPS